MNTKQMMSDKEYMEDVLMSSKQLTALYQHAVTEASTDTLHSQLKSNLNETIDIQHHIFQTMSSKGWYTAEPAQTQQISKLKTRYQTGTGM